CLFAPRLAQSQGTDTTGVMGTSVVTAVGADAMAGPVINGTKVPSDRPPVDREIAVMGMIPAGDYRMFSATVRCNAWTVGVEYDRDGWGHLLGLRIDYVAEVIPVLILSEPAKSDFW